MVFWRRWTMAFAYNCATTVPTLLVATVVTTGPSLSLRSWAPPADVIEMERNGSFVSLGAHSKRESRKRGSAETDAGAGRPQARRRGKRE